MNFTENAIQKISESSAPSKSVQKKLAKISNDIKNEILNFKDKRILKVTLGGSFAKGTWIDNDTDIDFFVMVEQKVDRKEFEELGKKVGFHALKKYKPYLRYSEHPYVEGKVDGIRVNIVPCYKVEKNRWKSAADRSPYHTDFMQKMLNEFLKSQVRVLKLFLKSIGTYGSQISISGFSGYVTEVLILKYGSFRNVLQIFAELRSNFIVSIDTPDEKIISKFKSPIIIIDPIDANRNLGAAISAECVAKFVLASRHFLKDPSFEFFKDSHKPNAKTIRQIKSNLLVVEFMIQRRSPDILWGQLKRKLASISKQLENARFKIIKTFCFTDEQKRAVFIFISELAKLPKLTVNYGPEIFLGAETDAFIKKRKSKSIMMFTEGMRIMSIEETKKRLIKEHTSLIIEKDLKSGAKTGIALDLSKGYSIYLANERVLNSFVSTAINHMVRDGEFIRHR
ncbi:CCA tRNA nucleotidyltransferase [soil metagenome]